MAVLNPASLFYRRRPVRRRPRLSGFKTASFRPSLPACPGASCVRYIFNNRALCFISKTGARDNTAATMWPCFQAKHGLIIAFMSPFGVATPLRHRGLNILRIFHIQDALLRCHVVVVAKLTKMSRAQLCSEIYLQVYWRHDKQSEEIFTLTTRWVGRN